MWLGFVAASIYVLIDPGIEEIRYVGWTSKTLEIRLRAHLNSRRNTHKDAWLRKLEREGLQVRISLVQQVPTDQGPQAECYWISYFRSIGCNLTNLTEGGEGTFGYQFSEESRAKMRESWTKRRDRPRTRKSPTKETREKLRQATLRQFESQVARDAVSKVHKGKEISPEHKSKLSTSTKKRWVEWRAAGGVTSEETKAKISAARSGKPVSNETKEKISASTRGRPKSEEHKAKIAASHRARKTK